MTIKEMIREWMKEQGVNMAELSRRCGWSRQNTNDKFRDERYPNFETIRRMVEALDREMIVQKKADFAEEIDLEELYATSAEQQISYEFVEQLLDTLGYEILFIRK